jgi:RimJ/RimL family protein N-acetyltransferase
MHEATISLRPVAEPDLVMFQRFATEPGLIGLDWRGYRDAGAPARRLAQDGYLADDNGRLIVESDGHAAGFVNWTAGTWGSACWEIGVALLPEWRGQGVGWRCQAMLCGYLFAHTPVQRIQAATHAENTAEQKALQKAGFQREGVLRAADFRMGQWHDGFLYSRLRNDPAPSHSTGVGLAAAGGSQRS